MSTKQIRRVGIVGMGYVGLPLALAFCKAGFRVVGVDVDERRVKALQAGISSIEDVSSEELAEAVEQGRFLPTTDYSLLREVESVSICVPTPLRKSREPDVSYVISAARTLAPHVQKGQTIILESTVYPGATEEVVAPALEGSGLKAGEDFYLAFSPERIDPANHTYALEDIPKLVGGVNQVSAEHAAEIYGQVFSEVVLLASAKEAEMAKLLENTFRAVNIGLVNELAIVAHRMGLNLWNVIDAASTKPFGFMPFYPGPGWGGHCIPVDPFYLAWRAQQDGFEVGFIEQASRINTRMPAYVVERVSDLLDKEGKPLRGS
ncbi:MAG: nucleotide sugar dehydrogenase, partial [Chloroflexi bacterium]|nr:nucleotide sugar dehydrogenase [Chloroflexota bacterium]